MSELRIRMTLQDKYGKDYSTSSSDFSNAKTVARSFAQLAKEMKFKNNNGVPYLRVEAQRDNDFFVENTFKLPINKTTKSFYNWFDKKLTKLIDKQSFIRSIPS